MIRRIRNTVKSLHQSNAESRLPGARSLRIRSGVLGLSCFAGIALLSAGCENARFGKREGGALGGAAVGAGLGAIIGHETGNTGAGIAIGSAVGALSGGVVGDQLDRTDDKIKVQDDRLGRQEREIDENRRMIEELRRRGTDAYSSDRGIVVNLPDVLFEVDSAKLTGEARDTVEEIVRVLEKSEERRLLVEGHTDSTGSVPYNQNLSEARARSVASELSHQGIAKSLVSSRGFGESDPIATNRTESGRRRNRRVEVIIQNRRSRR